MKIDNLVNGYVLTNLFYELMFLDETVAQETETDWGNPDFVESIIRSFVVPRYDELKEETKKVVENTLGYLLVAEPTDSELWDAIWQACSAPIPTPHGIREFMLHVYKVIFPKNSLPRDVEIFRINHSAQIANRLN